MGLTEKMAYSGLVAVAVYKFITLIGLPSGLGIALGALVIAKAFKDETNKNKGAE